MAAYIITIEHMDGRFYFACTCGQCGHVKDSAVAATAEAYLHIEEHGLR